MTAFWLKHVHRQRQPSPAEFDVAALCVVFEAFRQQQYARNKLRLIYAGRDGDGGCERAW